MPSEPTATPDEFDWDTQALWVQDRTMYLVLNDAGPEGDELTVQDQVGAKRKVSRKELEETHVPVRQATVYKSKYNPVQAFCPREDMDLSCGGQIYHVPSGDAIMREASGDISVVSRHEFNMRYQFVGTASSRAPFT